MKKVISILSALVMLMTAFTVVKADTVDIPAARPHFVGTFVQPWLYASWSDERADQEFTHMKDIGIQYIIMGDTVTKSKNGDSVKYDVTYPTTLDAAKNSYSGFDMVDMLLRYCKKYGMKCYLGMGNDTDWSFLYYGHRTDFINFCNFSASVAKDLYTQYKAKYPDTFYGFYFTPELCNCSSFNDTDSRNDCVSFYSDGFNSVLDTINKLDPTMPMMYSPYVNATATNGSLENTMTFYTDFYKKTNFRDIDILCPQDSIGAGGLTLDQLDAWTKGYKDAITASGKNSKLWSNCEDFVEPKSASDDWTSADVKRFIQQMDITSKYCEEIVTFAYPHYWSPINTASGFDRAYIQYLKTGETDNTPPTAPIKVRYEKEQGTTNFATLQWTPATDEFDIARYNIYKYDSNSGVFKKLGSTVILRRDGQASVPEIKTTFEAKYLTKTTIFALEAMDCAGNLSQKVIFQVDISKNDNGVDLSSAGGNNGITAVVDDLTQYAKDLHDGTTTTSSATTSEPSEITTSASTASATTASTDTAATTTTASISTTSTTSTTVTTASTSAPTSLSISTSTTVTNSSQLQQTTEPQDNTTGSGTSQNPKTGSGTTLPLGILTLLTLGLVVSLKNKKTI